MLEQYKRRWLKKAGEPIPEAIARMPLDVVERKLRLVESMDGVFVVPRDFVPEPELQPCSMMDHDKHGEFS